MRVYCLCRLVLLLVCGFLLHACAPCPAPVSHAAPILRQYSAVDQAEMAKEHQLLEHASLFACDPSGQACRSVSFPLTLAAYREWSDLRDQARILNH